MGNNTNYYYYYSFDLQSDAVPLQVHIDYTYYYKENPPSAHLKAKTSRVYRKNALPRLTLGKGKPISYYLLEQLSIQGFTCLYFTNIFTRCNTVEVLVLFTLLYIRFLAPFVSFIYYLIYSSIQLVYSERLQGGIFHFF